MDADEFRKWGKQMVDYIADYWTKLPSRRPQSNVKPGYMRHLIPEDPPENGESFDNIFADLETVIMQGVTHWHHPRFFAYFPTGNSYPAIMGDILSSGIGAIGFSWASSPAYTELELAVMDWLAKLVGLPDEFLYSSQGPGAGVIQSTASECVYLSMLAAKKLATSNLSDEKSESSFVAYTSDQIVYPETIAPPIQAHSCVQKAALMIGIRLRFVESDKSRRMTSEALQSAVEEDKKKGLIPFFVCVTLGTTACCAFDCLPEIGPLCQSQKLWLHVDAAYAGCATICPEYRWIFQGIQHADTINFNPHKAMMINFDCSAFWYVSLLSLDNMKLMEYLYNRMKDTRKIEHTFFVDPQYLKYDQQGLVPDLRVTPNAMQLPNDDEQTLQHWQIPLGRRFRSLKLWFTIRAFGADKIRENFRKMCSLAKYFASLVEKDQNFEIVQPVVLGVVCFRIKASTGRSFEHNPGSNEINEKAAKIINDKGDIYFSAVTLHDLHVLRLCISSTMTEKSDVNFAWQQIKDVANLLLRNGKDDAQR
ncbi:aromatic L amino acid decarboxylase [Trichuris trichiura]|uniref:Aromatic-L-amino-acid decarboxylase n=1 Tax=Trichuris trichiura TaxID=36087 RepID=A0A077Z8X3_TRITR|nr:aromatic L amino acid decarboxylase [Trichuris trichiura]